MFDVVTLRIKRDSQKISKSLLKVTESFGKQILQKFSCSFRLSWISTYIAHNLLFLCGRKWSIISSNLFLGANNQTNKFFAKFFAFTSDNCVTFHFWNLVQEVHCPLHSILHFTYSLLPSLTSFHLASKVSTLQNVSITCPATKRCSASAYRSRKLACSAVSKLSSNYGRNWLCFRQFLVAKMTGLAPLSSIFANPYFKLKLHKINTRSFLTVAKLRSKDE